MNLLESEAVLVGFYSCWKGWVGCASTYLGPIDRLDFCCCVFSSPTYLHTYIRAWCTRPFHVLYFGHGAGGIHKNENGVNE